MTATASVVAVLVGKPEIRSDEHGEFETALVKREVGGRVSVHAMGVDGDAQADRMVHGGVDKAILVASADRYPAWRTELGRPGFGPGALGENLAVTGLNEDDVAIGDVYAIGSAIVQVVQPRPPCWKLARVHGIPDLPRRVARTRRGGWYLRVLTPGTIAAGDAIVRVHRPDEPVSVATAFTALYGPTRDIDLRAALTLSTSDVLPEEVRSALATRTLRALAS